MKVQTVVQYHCFSYLNLPQVSLHNHSKYTMKVLVYSSNPYDQPALKQASLGKHELIFTEKKLNLETAGYAKGCEAIAIFTSDDGSAPVLEKLYEYGVRHIALRSVGHDHVDSEKAGQLKMKVANVPEYSPYSVAEHAVAMLMTVNRKIIEGQLLMKLQDFRLDTLKGFDVHGKTIGIIGTGKIGIAFAKIMVGFGTTILATDPQQNTEALALGIKYVLLDELLKSSDIVSIHCPLTPQTKHLLSSRQFEMMKKGSVLINTSRGAVINTTDLIEAIENGKLREVCLDVYEFEKGLFFEDHRADIINDTRFTKLKGFNNVLITGHQAFLTTEAIQGIAKTTIENLDCWEKGTANPNEIL